MALPIVTAKEMARIDARAIEDFGIPSTCLMETAGSRAAAEIWARYGRPGLRVVIACGKGNNGGDGFVIARYLMNLGAKVSVFILSPPEDVTGDPAVFLKILVDMGISPKTILEGEDIAHLASAAADADIFVDAMLGTGFSPPARGLMAEALSALSMLETPVASVDIPSGLDATLGSAEPPHIRAALTLTFGALKRSHVLMPAAQMAGEVVCLDIGIPAACVEKEGVSVHLTEPSDVADFLPERRADAHKGDAGQLLIIAGSSGMMGAALMTSLATLRIGGGLVTLAVPEPLAMVVEAGPPEVMALPLPATTSGTFDPAAFDLILEKAEEMDALVVGPGLTTHPRTVELVQRLIQHLDKPIVLDADGLNGLSQDLTVLNGPHANLILTPHPGEMARLLRISPKEVQADRVQIAVDFAARHRLHLALKGAGTIVAMPDGGVWINPTGTPALATAGAGDVLAGTIGGLLGQALAPEPALVAGVYLHGLAGEIAAEEFGEVGITATDLLPALPKTRRLVSQLAAEKKAVGESLVPD